VKLHSRMAIILFFAFQFHKKIIKLSKSIIFLCGLTMTGVTFSTPRTNFACFGVAIWTYAFLIMNGDFMKIMR
jgi:hypothetical protein